MEILIIFLVHVLLIAFWYLFIKKKKDQYSFWGMVKTLFQSYLIIFVFVSLGLIGLTVKVLIDFFPVKQKRTEKQMTEIKKSIIKYKLETGAYPSSLIELIGQNPIRKEWQHDYWGSGYKLIHVDEKTVVLSSAGLDAVFNTDDDLKLEINN